MDLDGDFTEEIILKTKHGVGSGHYIEDMRIFKEKYPELELIFSVRTLDSTFGFSDEMKKYNCDIVSEVEFTEPDAEDGARSIIVKSKKITYKDSSKAIEQEEELGTKTYI